MARSLKKGPFVDHHLEKKVKKMNGESIKKPIKTWSRRSMITPEMIGNTFDVHNGRKFLSVYVIRCAFDVHHFQAFIFFRFLQQEIVRIVVGAVVDDNHFKFGVLLVQQHRNEFAQIVLFIVRTYNHRNRVYRNCRIKSLF